MAVTEYRVRSNGVASTYNTKDHQMAMRIFLVDVVESELVDNIGQVMIAKEVGTSNEYPMRTAPALYKAGIISREIVVRGISNMLNISHYEADEMLDELVEEDEWLSEPLVQP